MRVETKTTNIYKFEELTEDQKQLAIVEYRRADYYDDWRERVYEDATQVGLKILSFDVTCAQEIHIKKTDALTATIVAKIFTSHYTETDTYLDAKRWEDSYVGLLKEQAQDEADQLCTTCASYVFIEELELYSIDRDFMRDIGESYLQILTEEWLRINTDKYIIEAIEANDYEFTSDGCIY